MAVNIYVQDCVEHKIRQSYSLNQLFKPKILTFMGLSGLIWPQCVLGTPWFQVSSRTCLVLNAQN